MTYAQLKAHIETMDNEQLNQDVTIFLATEDEYMPVFNIEYAEDNNDVLDKNHPFLIVNY